MSLYDLSLPTTLHEMVIFHQWRSSTYRRCKCSRSGAVNKRIGREVFSTIQDLRFQDTRRCHICEEMGHLRAKCPKAYQQEKDEADLTLAIPDGLSCDEQIWILESGSSRPLFGDETWVDDLKNAVGTCPQPDGKPLSISKRGYVMLAVMALGEQKIVKLTNVYYAKGLPHNPISYGILDEKGYSSTKHSGRRVLAITDGKNGAFDVDLMKNVLVVKAKIHRNLSRVRDVI
ncbi:unnamed protein product [Albugo candida]|uniref:Retrovirus-related Pol polyprotein from transposon TNT 1-94-like beta-barrel domain-containing protein n=1 Tax=Albugo candida TaxID=65357 RepID=A0A024G5W8_9STRA|nr:unnamed protein product [Albugo candida]|eukprot:CCI41913.1 unnamed protein product [Albugo candida]